MDKPEVLLKFAEYLFNSGGSEKFYVKARGIGSEEVELTFLPELGYPPITLLAVEARILIASIEAALAVTRQIDKLKESA